LANLAIIARIWCALILMNRNILKLCTAGVQKLPFK
jgi:hypothetical protein